jgi:hypothetical protein
MLKKAVHHFSLLAGSKAAWVNLQNAQMSNMYYP